VAVGFRTLADMELTHEICRGRQAPATGDTGLKCAWLSSALARLGRTVYESLPTRANSLRSSLTKSPGSAVVIDVGDAPAAHHAVAACAVSIPFAAQSLVHRRHDGGRV